MIGNEEGLAATYSQLGKTCFDTGRAVEAERCFNNASEHFVKLGNEVGEAACLRFLSDIYRQRDNLIAAIRCLERTVLIDTRYRLPTLPEDKRLLTELRAQLSSAHR
jgi:tetratricopeptide repeat protein